MLPSHGPPLPGSSLAATIAHRHDREAKVIAALADGGSLGLAAIAEAAYAQTTEAPSFLRELQTRAHLDRLVRLGRVEKAGDRYRAAGGAGNAGMPGTSIES